MEVNFIMEFNALMRYARNNAMPLRERMMLIALFYIANDRAIYDEDNQTYDWPEDFIPVTNGEMQLYSTLDKRAIDDIRNQLKQRGLIDFVSGYKNTRPPMYKINYLSVNVGYKIVPNDVPNSTPRVYPTKPQEYPQQHPKSVPNKAPFSKYNNTQNPIQENLSLVPTTDENSADGEDERERLCERIFEYGRRAGRNISKADCWQFIQEQDARSWTDGSGRPIRDIFQWFDGWLIKESGISARLNG